MSLLLLASLQGATNFYYVLREEVYKNFHEEKAKKKR